MKRTINSLYRGATAAVCLTGFVLLALAAGASDAGADLWSVTRMMTAGFVAFAGGCMLNRWGLR